MCPSTKTVAEAPLANICAIPFVRRARLLPSRGDFNVEADGVLEIRTPHDKRYFSALVSRSYLDRSVVNAIVGRVENNRRHHRTKGQETFVLARYIPTSAAEQFVAAGIGFADDPGNLHLRVGAGYNWTVLGKREPARLPEANRTTPATIQMLFQLATHPESSQWTVRDLAHAAGISKTKAAQLRLQFLREGILAKGRKGAGFHMTAETGRRLVAGYNEILRPKLLLGRYRAGDSADRFLTRLSREAAAHHLSYALTGAAAASLMQHFYQGPEVPIFLPAVDAGTLRALRLLPDRNGPVVLLKPFGSLVYWRDFDGRMVAPPWLVYAEMLSSTDPRLLEAAEELRREFLA